MLHNSESLGLDLRTLVNKKIQELDYHLAVCKKLPKGIGEKRILNKFLAEKKVLLKHASNLENLNEEHLRSSNVLHLSSVLQCALSSSRVVEILKPLVVANESGAKSCRIFVDVVADSGYSWIKVVARNPQALHQAEIGAGSYGRKTLIEQIEQLQACAHKHHHFYQAPQIKVFFAAGVFPEMKLALEERGVEVIERELIQQTNEIFQSPLCDERLQASNDLLHFITNVNGTQCCLKLHQIPQSAMLNLDVSTMIAYVSSLTNGSCNFQFQSAILSEQAQRERENPVKPCLDLLFRGRKLICCMSALKDFEDIVNTIGGDNEKIRAKEFMQLVDVVADQPSSKAQSLGKSCKVKNRPQLVFGTGDALRAVTVTANKGFLRAARAQGIKFVAFLHESRALTEAQEKTATCINVDSKDDESSAFL